MKNLKMITLCICLTLSPVLFSMAAPGSGQGDFQADRDRPGRGEGRSQEDRGKRFENWLDREAPEIKEKLETLKERNPEIAAKVMRGFHQNLFKKLSGVKGRRGDPETKEAIKNLMNLELSSILLAGDYQHAANDSEKESIAAELKNTLNQSFDAKQTLHQKQVEHLETRLKKLQEMTTKRATQKESIINARYDKLTGQPVHLDW